jgi:hypothetical protein
VLFIGTLVLSLSSLTVAIFMTACGQVPTFGIDELATADECATINKKLIQVDEFLVKVEKTSAFHLDEAAAAIPKTQITTSTNKKTMLKDGNRRKAELLEEQQRKGCKPQATK